MASRDQLLSGEEGLAGAPVPDFGEQMWNYYVRSYPDLVRTHYPDVTTATDSGR
jgi:hypothetical protein